MKEVKRMMPMRETPLTVPPSIISWLEDPRMDMDWSKSILGDMEETGVEVIARN